MLLRQTGLKGEEKVLYSQLETISRIKSRVDLTPNQSFPTEGMHLLHFQCLESGDIH